MTDNSSKIFYQKNFAVENEKAKQYMAKNDYEQESQAAENRKNQLAMAETELFPENMQT